MINFEKFVLLGFDLRLPWDGPHTVDSFLWKQAALEYQSVVDEGYAENIVQLLDCPPIVVEDKTGLKAIGMAIIVDSENLSIIEAIVGGNIKVHHSDTRTLIMRGWEFEGFDVADANGYFSVFGIDRGSSKIKLPEKLFKEKAKAKKIVKTASSLYPSHTPFIVCGVLSFRRAFMP